MVPKGDLKRRKILGVQARRQEKDPPVSIVLNLEPKGLDAVLLQVDPENCPAFLRVWYRAGHADAVPGNRRGAVSQRRIVEGGGPPVGGGTCAQEHHETYANDVRGEAQSTFP